MAWPVLAAAGVGAVAGFIGQRSANQQNRAIAREQMAFQERMSSSAYQRSMDDMRQAGLNPMLAYQQGGASTAGGASARMESELQPAVSSAVSGARLRAELRQIQEATRRTYEQSESERQGRAESRSRQDLYDRQSDLAKLQGNIFELQLPALRNSAAVERTGLGARGAVLDRIRQMILGGRGFINPIGGR